MMLIGQELIRLILSGILQISAKPRSTTIAISEFFLAIDFSLRNASFDQPELLSNSSNSIISSQSFGNSLINFK